MLKFLYDGFLEMVSGNWNSYIQKNAQTGIDFRDAFYEKMYPLAAIYLLIGAVLFCWAYYYYFNARYGNYYTLGRYFMMAVLAGVFTGLITFLTGRILFHSFRCPVTSHIIGLSGINFFYCIILFLGLSLLIKSRSPMGKRTPF